MYVTIYYSVGGAKVKSMQRSGTSKPKREITKITNSQNTKRTYGQPSEQLFPKWPVINFGMFGPLRSVRVVKIHFLNRFKFLVSIWFISVFASTALLK